MKGPTNKQKQIIHTIAFDSLGLSDQKYRWMLYGTFGVKSSLDLTETQAERFIDLLRDLQRDRGQLGPTRWGWGKNKYEALSGRPAEYARPSQLRKIEATWREVARNPTDEALREFIRNHIGVEHLIWLRQKHVKPVLVALKEMKKAKAKAAQGAETAKTAPSSKGTSTPDSPHDRPAGEPRSTERQTVPDLSRMTQAERVLWWLRYRGVLTPKEAQQELGVGRLAARIHDLRADGHRIVTHDLTVSNRYGETSTVAGYELKESADDE